MRRSIHSQVEGLYQGVAKGIGVKRHKMKVDGVVDTLIHSDTTRKAYLSVWHRIVDSAVKSHRIRNVDELTADHVQSWLTGQVEKRLAPLTIGQYCSAISKLEHALNALKRKKEAKNA